MIDRHVLDPRKESPLLIQWSLAYTSILATFQEAQEPCPEPLFSLLYALPSLCGSHFLSVKIEALVKLTCQVRNSLLYFLLKHCLSTGIRGSVLLLVWETLSNFSCHFCPSQLGKGCIPDV